MMEDFYLVIYYMMKFRKISLTRFKEIFHQINSSQKRKKDKKNENFFISNKKEESYDIIMNKINEKKNNNDMKEYEKEFKDIKNCFNKLVNSDDYLLGNIYQNETLMEEYKKSFKLEEFIISELNKKNNNKS